MLLHCESIAENEGTIEFCGARALAVEKYVASNSVYGPKWLSKEESNFNDNLN